MFFIQFFISSFANFLTATTNYLFNTCEFSRASLLVRAREGMEGGHDLKYIVWVRVGN